MAGEDLLLRTFLSPAGISVVTGMNSSFYVAIDDSIRDEIFHESVLSFFFLDRCPGFHVSSRLFSSSALLQQAMASLWPQKHHSQAFILMRNIKVINWIPTYFIPGETCSNLVIQLIFLSACSDQETRKSFGNRLQPFDPRIHSWNI